MNVVRDSDGTWWIVARRASGQWGAARKSGCTMIVTDAALLPQPLSLLGDEDDLVLLEHSFIEPHVIPV